MTPQPNPILSFVPLIFVVAVIYFLIIRPQQKQQKQLQKEIDALKNGDRVLTQGGIYGTVAAVKGEIIQIKIADNVKVDVSRNAISVVLKDAAAGSAPVVVEKA